MARRGRWTTVASAALSCALCLSGCHGRAAPAPAPAPVDSGPAPLAVALTQARAAHKRYLELAGNGPKWQAEVQQRYPSVFADQHLATRLPTGYDAAKLKAELVSDLAGAGLSVKTFHVKVDPATIPADRKIPDTLAPDEPFTWLSDEISRVVEVGVVVSPSSRKRIKKWVNNQWRSGRLLEVTRVELGSDTATLELSTWYLVPEVKVPVRHLGRIDPDEALSNAGVDLEAHGQSPRAQAARKLYQEINAQLPAINEAYGWEAKVRLLAARYAVFRHALARSHKHAFEDVLK